VVTQKQSKAWLLLTVVCSLHGQKKNATLKQGMLHQLSKEKYTTGASGR
jgi:hypothetical protein